MANVSLRPQVSYRNKLFLISALVGVLSLAGTVALGLGIGYDAGGAEGARIGLIVALLANALWIIPVWVFIPAYYRSLNYEIRQDEVIVRVGVVTRSVKHVPFRTVTNLKVSRGPFDRLFGIGTLHIQTAGMSGQTGAEESLVGLSDVQVLYEQVAEALRRFRGAMAPTQAEQEPLPASGDVLAAILDELKNIRRAMERHDPRGSN